MGAALITGNDFLVLEPLLLWLSSFAVGGKAVTSLSNIVSGPSNVLNWSKIGQ
jgi:hypothetical protein